jgi:hypothetical protein
VPTWTTGSNRRASPDRTHPPPPWPPGAAQWTVAAIAVVLAGGMIAFRLLNDIGLGQTAALYIGLPTVLAVALTLTPRASSAKGMAVKGVAIGVLLSGIVLGEGLVCILMASPLFFLIALLVGYSVDRARERRGAARVLLAVPLLLSVMSLEGVTDATSLPRDEVVTVTRMVAAGPAEVEAALARTPSFDRERPLFLRLGFPQPLGGEGLDVGDRRTVLLSRHARHYPHHHGTLVLEVADRAEGRATFRVVGDTTPIASWVRWREADVSWEQAGPAGPG